MTVLAGSNDIFALVKFAGKRVFVVPVKLSVAPAAIDIVAVAFPLKVLAAAVIETVPEFILKEPPALIVTTPPVVPTVVPLSTLKL
jgi:hypothetical protein